MRKVKNIVKKVLIVCGFVLITSVDVYAEEDVSTREVMIEKLVDNGYTISTADALSEEDLEQIYLALCGGKEVEISTCVEEIDNLELIEEFMSCEEEELQDMGMNANEIKDMQEEITALIDMTDEKLISTYGLDSTEVKMLRQVYENAEINKNTEKLDDDEVEEVVASGSISASKLSYTQTVTKNKGNKPNYDVKLSYSWTTPYGLSCFNDKIVVAWGGNLNCKECEGTADYYGVNLLVTKWKGKKLRSSDMSIDITPNTGIIFTFKQAKGIGSNGNWAKTKKGRASFVLYQTKKQGYETTLVSRYCHRIISIKSSSISISSSGAGASISIGGGWDKSKQQSSVVAY